MNDILLLTKADEANYRALCNFARGRSIRRTKSRRLADTLTPAQRLALLVQQDYRCAHCKNDFVFRNGKYHDATADHIIQFKYGGEANKHNIILVHYACNLERDLNYTMEMIEEHYGPIDKSLLEYVPVVSFFERQNDVSVIPIGDKRDFS